MSQTPPTPVDDYPPAPSSDNPVPFAGMMDTFLAAMSSRRAQFNAGLTNVYNNAADCYNNALSALASANSASASAAAAASAANVTKWISGASYTEGATVWSPIDFMTYRRKTTGGGAVDPSMDYTNWACLTKKRLRNFITNGGFTVSTAGTSFTNCANSHTLVGWYVYGAPANVTMTRVPQPYYVSGSGYGVRFGRMPGETLINAIGFGQAIKTIDSYELAGKIVTLAFKANKTPNFSGAGDLITIRIIWGTGVDQNCNVFTGGGVAGSTNIVLTDSSVTYSLTAGIPSSATQVGIKFEYTPTGTAGVTDMFDVNDIQLRIEDTFSTLEQTPDSITKLACAELCESSFMPGTTPGQYAGVATGEFRFNAPFAGAVAQYAYIPFRAPKRNNSFTITLFNPSGANAQIRDIAAAADFSATIASANGNTGFNLSATGNAATSAGNRCGVHWLVRNEL